MQIKNGLIRLTASAVGTTPSLAVQGFRPAVTVADYYGSVYPSVYPGTTSTPVWLSVGTLVIDSPAVTATLDDVQVIRQSHEAITARLLCSEIGDAFVTLRRGFRSVSIQHGTTRPPIVDIDRRIRWTDTPPLVGTEAFVRVEEGVPEYEGFPRFVAAIDTATVNAGAFSATAVSATTARFGAGVGIAEAYERAADHHGQLLDASESHLVLT